MKKVLLLILAILIITSNLAYGTIGNPDPVLELWDIENHWGGKIY